MLVELNTTELLLSCAFNFLKLLKVVLFYYDFFHNYIIIGLNKVKPGFKCRVSCEFLLILLVKKYLACTGFINFIKALMPSRGISINLFRTNVMQNMAREI